VFSDAVRCGVEYLSCKLLALTVESWEFVLRVTALSVQFSDLHGLVACLATLFGVE
jgi:hypothetical protein